MYARYSKGKLVLVSFDTWACKELDPAYLFFNGGNARAKFKGEVGEKMREIEEALKHDIIERNERDEESKNFQICSECQTEVDLRMLGTYFLNPKTGMVQHFQCPSLRPREERDIDNNR